MDQSSKNAFAKQLFQKGVYKQTTTIRREGEQGRE
jgi:hypothetical protein